MRHDTKLCKFWHTAECRALTDVLIDIEDRPDCPELSSGQMRCDELFMYLLLNNHSGFSIRFEKKFNCTHSLMLLAFSQACQNTILRIHEQIPHKNDKKNTPIQYVLFVRVDLFLLQGRSYVISIRRQIDIDIQINNRTFSWIPTVLIYYSCFHVYCGFANRRNGATLCCRNSVLSIGLHGGKFVFILSVAKSQLLPQGATSLSNMTHLGVEQ